MGRGTPKVSADRRAQVECLPRIAAYGGTAERLSWLGGECGEATASETAVRRCKLHQSHPFCPGEFVRVVPVMPAAAESMLLGRPRRRRRPRAGG